MHEHSFEEDLSVTREALATGDLKHAAHHLAGAVSLQPLHKDVQALLAGFQEKAGSRALGLLPLAKEVFHGAAAAHAWLLQSEGRTSEAVPLLVRVQTAMPSVPYLKWLEWWLEDGAALKALDPERLAAAAQGFFHALPPEEPGPAKDALKILLDVLARVVPAHPESAQLFFVSCVAMRRAGRVDEALAMALRRREGSPDYFTFVALAGIHRQRGQLAEAVEDFKSSLEFEPDDAGPRLDIGDLSLDLGRLPDALVAYQQALELEPDNDWALPSSLYVRYRLHRDVAAREQLRAYAAAHPDNDRARMLVDRLDPFVLSLPRRTDALVNLAAQALHQLKPGSKVSSIAVSSIESPSAILTLRRALEEKEVADELRISFAEIPQPDPREPVAPVTVQVWTYGEGGHATPALEPPPEEIFEAVSSLARRPYEIAAWWDEAGSLVRSLPAPKPRELLAAMVHPPKRPEHLPPWEWIFRLQIAAAMVVARLDDAWPGPRRDALFSLAQGPVDWTATAALVALSEVAVRDARPRGEIADLFFRLLELPKCPIRHMCLREPLSHLAGRIPGLSAGRQAILEELKKDVGG